MCDIQGDFVASSAGQEAFTSPRDSRVTIISLILISHGTSLQRNKGSFTSIEYRALKFGWNFWETDIAWYSIMYRAALFTSKRLIEPFHASITRLRVWFRWDSIQSVMSSKFSWNTKKFIHLKMCPKHQTRLLLNTIANCSFSCRPFLFPSIPCPRNRRIAFRPRRCLIVRRVMMPLIEVGNSEIGLWVRSLWRIGSGSVQSLYFGILQSNYTIDKPKSLLRFAKGLKELAAKLSAEGGFNKTTLFVWLDVGYRNANMMLVRERIYSKWSSLLGGGGRSKEIHLILNWGLLKLMGLW